MESLVYGVVAASTTMAGGLWLASRPRKWLTTERLAGLMALGAGLLLAVLTFDLLPEAVEHGGANAWRWIFGGVMTVLLFERYVAPHLSFLTPHGVTHEHTHDHALLSHGAACSALGSLLVHRFFDGVAMSAAFSVSAPVGVLVAIAIFFHMLPDGMLGPAVVLAAGSSASNARRAAYAMGAAFLLGLVLPMLLGSLLGSMAYALPLAAGVLLYVVFAQLLPVAVRSANGVPLVAAGALIFGLLDRLLPHAH